MIPKVIHYCWFGGGAKPDKVKKCINSWYKYCSDYKIIEWNESNFDVNINKYTAKCYADKKYAFLTDYVRLYVVEKYGGIYLDTDVELIKDPSKLLDSVAFFGFEKYGDSSVEINTGLGFGSESHGKAVLAMLSEYNKYLNDNEHRYVACTKLNTRALLLFGLKIEDKYQRLDVADIYPHDVFCPFDGTTGKLEITNKTISIHWYDGSWQTRAKRFRVRIMRPLHSLFGVDCFRLIKKIMHIK